MKRKVFDKKVKWVVELRSLKDETQNIRGSSYPSRTTKATMSLNAYRHLLRSAHLAFRGMYPITTRPFPSLHIGKEPLHGGEYNCILNFIAGDAPLLHAARDQMRSGFRKNASLLPEDPAVAAAIKHAEEVAKILTENIVQGEHVGNDKYSMIPLLFALGVQLFTFCTRSILRPSHLFVLSRLPLMAKRRMERRYGYWIPKNKNSPSMSRLHFIILLSRYKTS